MPPTKAKLNFQGFKRQLKPFQRQGVQFVEDHRGRALIGDEMGLGKTVQALAYLHLHPELRPALVICPASLKLNWEVEIYKCLGESTRIHIISGRKPATLPRAHIYIINYDIMANQREKKMVHTPDGWKQKRVAIPNTGWLSFLPPVKYVIIDECHYLGNRSADRTADILTYLSKPPKPFLPLSGTPITSRPIQFYPILKALAPSRIPPRITYGKKFCDGKHNGFGWDFNGASNVDKLYTLLSDIMIRRLKKDVLKELPEKQRVVVPMELTGKAAREYWRAETDFLEWLKHSNFNKYTNVKETFSKAMIEMQELSKLSCRAKWENVINWIKDTMESVDKIIIFAIHREVVDALYKDLAKYNPLKFDGRDVKEERQARVVQFQSDPSKRIIITTMRTGGVGHTLTAAQTVVAVEVPQTPGEMVQAEDRAHRIGQRGCVTAYYLLSKGTVEERLAKMLDKKSKVLAGVLDGVTLERENLLISLLKSYDIKNP